MNERIKTIARRRVEAMLSRIAAADLPPGLSAMREGDAVVIRGRGLLRALADDARLRGLAGGGAMSALAIAQAALQATLRGHAPLADAVSGVHLAPPPRAAFPYVTIGGAASADWSHKTGRGREIRLGASLWDDDPARATALTDALEAAVEAMPRVLAGHRIVSLVHLRTRMLRERGDGPWVGIVEYRVRTLED